MAARPAASPSSSSHIPDDILLFQILIRLPVKCLVRFRSVSKLWRATITSTHFVHCHLQHSRTRSSMLIIHDKFGIPGVNFYRFHPGQSKVAELILEKRCPSAIPILSIPLHCDGLILIPCIMGPMYVCNPATREFVGLPQGGGPNIVGGHRVAFGFDPSSGKYKVARHFLRRLHPDGEGTTLKYCHGHEILTIGDGEDAWKWKATMDPPYPINDRTPVCLPGFFYWSALHSVTGHGHSKVSTHVILRFSLHDETFNVHHNPPCGGFQNNDMLCELGGKLCYVHSSSPWDVAIWLAEDDGSNRSWSQRCCVILPIPRLLHVFASASTDRDKIFLSIDAWNLLKCDMRNGSLEKIINMAHDMLYDHGNGTKFCIGELRVAQYVVPSVESLLRIRP